MEYTLRIKPPLMVCQQWREVMRGGSIHRTNEFVLHWIWRIALYEVTSVPGASLLHWNRRNLFMTFYRCFRQKQFTFFCVQETMLARFRQGGEFIKDTVVIKVCSTHLINVLDIFLNHPNASFWQLHSLPLNQKPEARIQNVVFSQAPLADVKLIVQLQLRLWILQMLLPRPLSGRGKTVTS